MKLSRNKIMKLCKSTSQTRHRRGGKAKLSFKSTTGGTRTNKSKGLNLRRKSLKNQVGGGGDKSITDKSVVADLEYERTESENKPPRYNVNASNIVPGKPKSTGSVSGSVSVSGSDDDEEHKATDTDTDTGSVSGSEDAAREAKEAEDAARLAKEAEDAARLAKEAEAAAKKAKEAEEAEAAAKKAKEAEDAAKKAKEDAKKAKEDAAAGSVVAADKAVAHPTNTNVEKKDILGEIIKELKSILVVKTGEDHTAITATQAITGDNRRKNDDVTLNQPVEITGEALETILQVFISRLMKHTDENITNAIEKYNQKQEAMIRIANIGSG